MRRRQFFYSQTKIRGPVHPPKSLRRSMRSQSRRKARAPRRDRPSVWIKTLQNGGFKPHRYLFSVAYHCWICIRGTRFGPASHPISIFASTALIIRVGVAVRSAPTTSARLPPRAPRPSASPTHGTKRAVTYDQVRVQTHRSRTALFLSGRRRTPEISPQHLAGSCPRGLAGSRRLSDSLEVEK
jgi:hypothetical protein